MTLTLPPVSEASSSSSSSHVSRKERTQKVLKMPLKDFKVCADRDWFLEKNWCSPLANVFRSQSEFMIAIDQAHEDLLRNLKVKQIIGSHDLLNLLKSNYATLSDEEFVKCNALDVESNVLNGVARRLSYIQENNRELIFPPDVNLEIGRIQIFFIKKISLREVRHLDTDGKISRIFSDNLSRITLLSPEQKERVRDQHLFETLLSVDKEEEIQKYLPKIDSIKLNTHLRNLSYSLDKVPVEVIPLLNLERFSDGQFKRLMFSNRYRLDTVPMPGEKITEILNRSLQMTMHSDEVEYVMKTKDGGSVCLKRLCPRLHPRLWEGFPDSIFVKLSFQELSKDQLFRLFYPKSFETDATFGVVIFEENGLVNIHSKVLDLDGKGFDSSGLIISSCGMRIYEGEVKARENYNKRRLALLGKEVYDAIKPNLHPDMVTLGDEIFYPSSKSISEKGKEGIAEGTVTKSRRSKKKRRRIKKSPPKAS